MENHKATWKHELEFGSDMETSLLLLFVEGGRAGGWGEGISGSKKREYHSISVWKNISRYGMFLQGDLEDAKHLNEYVIPSSVKHVPALWV